MLEGGWKVDLAKGKGRTTLQTQQHMQNLRGKRDCGFLLREGMWVSESEGRIVEDKTKEIAEPIV